MSPGKAVHMTLHHSFPCPVPTPHQAHSSPESPQWGLAQPLPHCLAEQVLQSLRPVEAGPLGQMGPHALMETSGWWRPGG